MADQPNIFDANTPTPAQQQQDSNPVNVQNKDPIADLLASVRNERGEPKYKDVNEAFNGLKHAQEYIPTLKNELSVKEQALADAQAEISRLREAEASLLAITAQRQQAAAPQAPAQFDESKIADMVAQTLSKREQAVAQQNNTQLVVNTLQQVFGADAGKVFYEKGNELGMSQAEMNALAAKSPKAVLNMLGVTGAPKQNVSPTNGSINTEAYQPKKDSFVGRNTKSAMIGATTEDLQVEVSAARNMVDELHAAGLTVHDLTDPKIYRKYFK